jgi:hypothetical protein
MQKNNKVLLEKNTMNIIHSFILKSIQNPNLYQL